MKKHWVISSKDYMHPFETLNEAVNKAKIKSTKEQFEYIVYEAIQVTKTPIPNIEMITL